MKRRLAAILVADVVDYSRLMGEDQSGTLAALRLLREELFEPVVVEFQGAVVKRMGDGWIVEFAGVSDAVDCAIKIQTGLKFHEKIRLRIGIHIGEVVFEADDVFGDGVNVAARLEAQAKPGSVLISDTAYNSLDGKSAKNFHGGENLTLKNIARPVAVWHWPEMTKMTATAKEKEALVLPDKPSIAVLPFNNLSSDVEQAFFADGIVEDLTTALSRFHWLFVIARNSSFTYKGRSVQVRQVAQELGVRYVVEGSVRMSPSRLRVTVQLIDAENDRHVWAENYDRPTGDLFDLQDEISQTITGVLVPALSQAERERSLRDNRPRIDAWMAYQRGLVHYYRPYSDEDHREARRLFDQSIELDPNFADAYAMIGMMGMYSVLSGQSSYSGTFDEILSEAKEAAEKAVQLDDNNALAHIAIGRANQIQGLYNAAIVEGETSIKLNPNLAMAHHELGFTFYEAGRFEESVACFDRAIRLSPNDPSRWNFYLIKALSLFFMDELDRSKENHEEASRLRPTAFWPFVGLAAVYVKQGKMADAQIAIKETLKRNPDWSLARLVKMGRDLHSYKAEQLVSYLREAGLPEG